MSIFNNVYQAYEDQNSPIGSGYIRPTDKKYASKTYASIIGDQYDDYLERFQPYEQRLVDLAQSRELLDQQLSRISVSNAASFSNPQMSAGNLQMSRYGVQQSEQQQAKSTRQNSMRQALSLADAKNNTRLANQDQRMGLITGASGSRSNFNNGAYGG